MADEEIKVRVKFTQDFGDQKEGSTKTVTLAEANRLRWRGVATQESGATNTKKD